MSSRFFGAGFSGLAPGLAAWRQGEALRLDFVAGKYRVGAAMAALLSSMPGYAADAPPTITPGTGFVVAGGEAVRLAGSVPPPTGDFTFVVVVLSPAADSTFKVAAAIDDGFTSGANGTELIRNNAGNHQRTISKVSSATRLDNASGTGTAAVTSPAVAGGAEMRFGVYREAGQIKPILYGTKRAGTAAHTLALDTLRIGHRMNASSVNAEFTGGTVQRILLVHRVLSDAEIAAL